MRLRHVLAVGLVVPALAAPVITPASAAPRPVTPEIDTVAINLQAAPDSQSVESTDGQRTSQQGVSAAATTSGSGATTLTTPPIDTDTFASVGASWAPGTGDGAVIEVRTGSGDGFGAWTALPVLDSGPDPDTEEGRRAVHSATEALWVGDSEQVQVRVTAAPGAVPDDLELALVDPGTSPADGLPARPPASADAAGVEPAILSRAQWGANESLKNCGASYNSTIKAGVVHHTAGPNSYSTVAEAMRQLRSDYAYHTQRLGWCDLGYNFVVDKWGHIYEGRAGGVDKAVVGAHAGGFNKDTFGVSMLGDFSTVAPPQAMTHAVAQVVGWKLSMYGMSPHATTTLVSAGGGTAKYARGQAVKLPTVMGHRDVGSTACPGARGYATLNQVRGEAGTHANNTAFVRALYHDMMDRSPDVAGLRGWTAALTTSRSDARQVSRGFSHSTEYRLLSIEQAYQQVLGRNPDRIGQQTWLANIASGRLRIDQLRPVLMSSAEFYSRGGSSDAAFVDNIYQAALGRRAAASDIAVWAPVRRSRGPQAVIAGVWGSPEAGRRRVAQAYEYYLGRGAAYAEQKAWLPVVLGAGDEQLREGLVASREYFVKASTRFP